MKKYLLAVLALGATMMMACQPSDDGKGGNGSETKADYSLTSAIEGFLDGYGDMYGVGANDFNLALTGVGTDASGTIITKILYMEYLTDTSNTSGLGTFAPAAINWQTGEGLTPNTYLAAAELEGEIVGCGYIEMDVAAEEITAYEGIVSGDLTISKEGNDYVVKGLFTTLSGKTLNVDAKCPLEFEDFSNQGGIAPLSVKKSLHFAPASKYLKK